MEFTDIIIKDNHGTEYYPVVRQSTYSPEDIVIYFKQINSKFGRTASWLFKSIMNHTSELLYIDAGQGWCFENIQPTIAAIKAKFGC